MVSGNILNLFNSLLVIILFLVELSAWGCTGVVGYERIDCPPELIILGTMIMW